MAQTIDTQQEKSDWESLSTWGFLVKLDTQGSQGDLLPFLLQIWSIGFNLATWNNRWSVPAILHPNDVVMDACLNKLIDYSSMYVSILCMDICPSAWKELDKQTNKLDQLRPQTEKIIVTGTITNLRMSKIMQVKVPTAYWNTRESGRQEKDRGKILRPKAPTRSSRQDKRWTQATNILGDEWETSGGNSMCKPTQMGQLRDKSQGSHSTTQTCWYRPHHPTHTLSGSMG